MKKKIIYAIVSVITILVTFSECKTTSLAFSTWEEAREWFKENGVSVSQGGTYDEYSTCPGETTPNNNSSTSTNNTPQTESKPEKNPTQPVHKHSYIETVTKEPTCVEEGVKTFTCSCGDKYTEPIEMVEHTYDKNIVTQEPTCTVNGTKLISCSICNDTYEEDIKPLGHEKGEWVTTKEPTCTETGNEVVSCKRCGEQLEERSINALEHNDGQWITAKGNTLFTEGLKELRCTTCDEVLETEVIPINMNTWYVIIGVISAIVIILTVIGISSKFKKNRKAIK